MGISGLLPALKSIQKTKHLSEYKGQTIAVDAYVWLHKGVYACATELATGKPTHKYVDYAMHRVRLLRHFGIEPYIVFDGGPLPAKRSTELERKKRRDENLRRGHALAAQGKHSQARECYIKCVDVTPQMAFQFIKALRAEQVQYVVAPYEADAQMAYLERIGLVSAILTEDSDLLVFGCKHVLFKLDPVASTVVSISRADFGLITSTASDTTPISLVGWSDSQFRAMAILSGCDYLPSIPGIGLKTACMLLRKWKTPEGVIKAITLEGKKSVPPRYLEQFRLAEKCFKFQRVYDSSQEKLVHLVEIGGEWDEETDTYVGEDIDPLLARSIATGDVDPVTRQPMNDIDPKFLPRILRPLPVTSNLPSQKDKGKGKATSGGILNFFGPNPIIPHEKPPTRRPMERNTTGKWSGKRTLGEVMDHDISLKKRHPSQHISSKFFASSTSQKRAVAEQQPRGPTASPPRMIADKENIPITHDDDDDEVTSNLSLQANIDQEQDFELEEPHESVEQEEGYMSPFSECSQWTQDLSSPVRSTTPARRKRKNFDENKKDELDVDPVSSPLSALKRRRSYSPPGYNNDFGARKLQFRTPTRSISLGSVLVLDTPVREVWQEERPNYSINEVDSASCGAGLSPPFYNGPDLRSCYSGEEGDVSEEVDIGVTSAVPPCDVRSGRYSSMGSKEQIARNEGSIPPSPSPRTPDDDLLAYISDKNVSVVGVDIDPIIGTDSHGVHDSVVIGVDEEGRWDDDVVDLDEEVSHLQQESIKTVAQGWRIKWALNQCKGSPTTSNSLSAARKGRTGQNPKEERRRRQSMPQTVTKLRRSETNVTPLGRHSLGHRGQQRLFPWSAPSKTKAGISKGLPNVDRTTSASNKTLLRARPSLDFSDVATPTIKKRGSNARLGGALAQAASNSMDVEVEDAFSDVEVLGMSESLKAKLSQFRRQ